MIPVNSVMMLMAAGSSWKISTFLNSLQQTIAYYGSILVSLFGVVMVIVGVYQIAKNLISSGRGQTNWIVTFALILVGGALAVTGGWKMIGQFAQGSKNTLSGMAQGNAETDGADLENPFEIGST